MKKAFTLIELLAVIIILAIIALIATPVVMNVIEQSKKAALKDSAYGLIDSARYYHMQYNLEETARFDIKDSVVTTESENKISFQGKIENGIVLVNEKGRIALCLNENDYSVYKNYKDADVTLIDNKSCDIPTGTSIVYLAGEATITEYTNQELTQIIKELQNEIDELENNKKDTTSAGTVIAYMASKTAPEGYLLCDGSIYDISEYPELAESIKNGFGKYNYYGGDGETTFAVPDLRGEFLRGSGTATRNTGSGSTVGIHQDATNMPYILTFSNGSGIYTGYESTSNFANIFNQDTLIKSNATSKNQIYFPGTLQSRTADRYLRYTFRPTNTSVLYCIKY